MKKKNNIVGFLMAAGVGLTTGLIYFIGKIDGRCEAFTDIANELQKLTTEHVNTEK